MIPLKADKSFDIRVEYMSFSSQIIRIKFISIGYIDAKESFFFVIKLVLYC